MNKWTLVTLKPVIEAMIFASSRPLTLANIRQTIGDAPLELIKQAIELLKREYSEPNKGLELVQVAKGYRIQTRPQYKQWVLRSGAKTGHRLSRAALETLAVIAYRQPVTRAEIEGIRGVDSSGTIRYLLSKNLIRIAGRKDVPGRPLLYGTTSYFLEVFQLKSLKDLPRIEELDDSVKARQNPLFDTKAAS
ncbi:MAG: SMC-Scp complex subunit ScpB [Thermodesulfobacteria bacterium]|nr:SMC-Scp complex subunit ScpB [Thermodesulfobacteriota bacterium]